MPGRYQTDVEAYWGLVALPRACSRVPVNGPLAPLNERTVGAWVDLQLPATTGLGRVTSWPLGPAVCRNMDCVLLPPRKVTIIEEVLTRRQQGR